MGEVGDLFGGGVREVGAIDSLLPGVGDDVFGNGCASVVELEVVAVIEASLEAFVEGEKLLVHWLVKDVVFDGGLEDSEEGLKAIHELVHLLGSVRVRVLKILIINERVFVQKMTR